MKEPDQEDFGCDPVVSIAAFQVVDKTSGADLFSGDVPKYKRSDLKVYHFNYKKETDTLPLRFSASPNGQAFVFEIEPAKARDTVLIKIAETRIDTLIFAIKKPKNPCLRSIVEQASFNGSQVPRDVELLLLRK